MKNSKKAPKFNPVAKFMSQGETGWKSTSKSHPSGKIYKRHPKHKNA